MRRISISIVLALSTLAAALCSGQQTATTSTAVPNLISYSGTLKDAQGAVVSSTPLGVTFAIYKQQDGGAPIWQEAQNITPDSNGSYTVLLGSTAATGLPDDLFSQQEQRWLGVQVQGQAEQPRALLVSVPYALKAQEAETLGGLPASAFVKAPPLDGPGGTYVGTSGSVSQNAGAAGNKTNTTKAGVGIDTIVNCVGAKNGTIPIWTGSAPPNITLCNSGIYEASPYGSGAIGILNPNPIAALDVTGATNTSLYYQIGSSTVLSIGSPGDANLFLGAGAGASNIAGQGQTNVFSGNLAGFNNTTGKFNVFSGHGAGYSNTTGISNIFSGNLAGYYNTTGHHNTFSGDNVGLSNTTGFYNAFFGAFAGYYNTTGNSNTFFGGDAGEGNTTGVGNTFSGYNAGLFNASGNYNTFFGSAAGANNTTGNNNIYIGNPGCPYPCAENSTIRIGGDIGNGYGPQTAAYISGIYGTSTSGGTAVFVDSTGKLGTTGGTVSGLVMTSIFQNYTDSVDISCPNGYSAVLASCQAGVNVVLNDINTILPPGASSWADYLTPNVNNATGVHCDVGAGNQSQAQLRCAQH